MKKFVRHIIYFSLCIVLVFSALNLYHSFYHFEPTHYTKKYKELTCEITNPSNVSGIVIGNSHAAYSIRPSIMKNTEVNYYNFAYGRATINFYHKWIEAFLDAYLEKEKGVKYCIISVGNYFIKNSNERQLEQDSEYMSLTTLSSLLYNGTLNRTSLFMHYFPAYKYRKKLLRTFKAFNRPSPFKVDEYDNGFIPYDRLYQKKNFNRKRVIPPSISETKKESFHSLLDKFIERKVKIYLVMPPEYHLSPSDYADLRSFMDDTSIKYKIPFFDYNDKSKSFLFDDVGYFSDPGHLNGAGSLVFSNHLAQTIKTYETQSKR